MGRKLFVGNLPFTAGDADLVHLFEPLGRVDHAKVIFDHASGKSKGFGFVEMATEEDAARCLSELNGADVDGRAITVADAKPSKDQGLFGRSLG